MEQTQSFTSAASTVDTYGSAAGFLIGLAVCYVTLGLFVSLLHRLTLRVWTRAFLKKSAEVFFKFESAVRGLSPIPWCMLLIFMFVREEISLSVFVFGLSCVCLLRLSASVAWGKEGKKLGAWFRENAVAASYPTPSQAVHLAAFEAAVRTVRPSSLSSRSSVSLLTLIFVIVRALGYQRFPFVIDFVCLGFAWGTIAFVTMPRASVLRKALSTAAILLFALFVWKDAQAIASRSLFWVSVLFLLLGALRVALRPLDREGSRSETQCLSPVRLQQVLERIELGISTGWASRLSESRWLSFRNRVGRAGFSSLVQGLDVVLLLAVCLVVFA